MSRYVGNNDQCPYCQLLYRDFKTGLTYAEVQRTLWNTEPAKWKRWVGKKGRNTVLGKWHEIKQTMWEGHIDECERYFESNCDGLSGAQISEGIDTGGVCEY